MIFRFIFKLMINRFKRHLGFQAGDDADSIMGEDEMEKEFGDGRRVTQMTYTSTAKQSIYHSGRSSVSGHVLQAKSSRPTFRATQGKFSTHKK